MIQINSVSGKENVFEVIYPTSNGNIKYIYPCSFKAVAIDNKKIIIKSIDGINNLISALDYSEIQINGVTPKSAIDAQNLLADVVFKIGGEVGNNGGLIYKGLVDDVVNLPETSNIGDAYIVKNQKDENGNSYIYQWDGEQWNNTGLTAFPSDVATKKDIESINSKISEINSGGIEIEGVYYPFSVLDGNSKKVSFGVDSTGKFISFAHPQTMVDDNNYEKSKDNEILYAIKDENDLIALAIYSDGTTFINQKNTSLESDTNSFTQFSELNYILLNGQSLANGNEAYPAISTNAENIGTLMFSTGVRTWQNAYGTDPSTRPEVSIIELRENGNETISSGFLNSFKNKLIGLHSPNNKNTTPYFMLSYCGDGGRYLRELDKRHDDAKDERAGSRRSNGGYYKTGINDIERAKKYADNNNLKFNVQAVCWMQGEAEGSYMVNRWDGALDADTFLTTNKADLSNLIEDYNNDIISITGQKNKPLFLCYKTTGWASGRSQYELMLEDKLIMVSPLYYLPMAPNALYPSGNTWVHGDPVHLANDGERWLGEQFAKVLKRVTINSEDWKPFYPVASKRSSDNKSIYVRFNVPRPPIVIDTKFIVNAKDYGFYIDQNNQRRTINSIELVSSDTVKITLSASLTSDVAYLSYGQAMSQSPISLTISDIQKGEDNSFGFSTTNYFFTGDITNEFLVAQKDGAFIIRNFSTNQLSRIRKVSFDGTNTVLNAEDREAGSLNIGDTVYLSRFRAWGNLRDSDNEISNYQFGDITNGRTGNYKLWNWLIDFQKFNI